MPLHEELIDRFRSDSETFRDEEAMKQALDIFVQGEDTGAIADLLQMFLDDADILMSASLGLSCMVVELKRLNKSSAWDILGCFFNLATQAKYREPLGLHPGVLDALVIATKSDNVRYQSEGLRTLQWLVIHAKVTSKFARDGHLPVFFAAGKNADSKFRLYGIGSLFNMFHSPAHCREMDSFKNIVFPEASVAMIDPNELVAMFAAFCVANIKGQEEIASSQDFVLDSKIINLLVECIENAANCKSYRGLAWLPMCIFSLHNLSISEHYKSVLATERMVNLLIEYLNQYKKGTALFTSEVTGITLMTLLNLLLGEESGKFIKSNLTGERSTKVQDLITAVSNKLTAREAEAVYDGGSEAYSRDEAVQAAGNIIVLLKGSLNVLTPQNILSSRVNVQPEAEAIDSARSVAGKAKHVMVSYCWANKDKAKIVSQKLRLLGFDVWRDEDGSSCVPPMKGNINSVMADAVESSALVVAIISEGYKKSANCRMEAEYAFQLKRNEVLDMVYIMADPNYTTLTKERRVDGWLGLMVGQSLWYPAFDDAMIDDSVHSIVESFQIALDAAKIGNKTTSYSTAAPTTAAASVTTTPAKIHLPHSVPRKTPSEVPSSDPPSPQTCAAPTLSAHAPPAVHSGSFIHYVPPTVTKGCLLAAIDPVLSDYDPVFKADGIDSPMALALTPTDVLDALMDKAKVKPAHRRMITAHANMAAYSHNFGPARTFVDLHPSNGFAYDWLKSVSPELGQYASIFGAAGIDSHQALGLTSEKDLEKLMEVGRVKPGHHRVILQKHRDLNSLPMLSPSKKGLFKKK